MTLVVAAALAATLSAAPAAQLQRVLLLPVAGRVSIVLEMSGAPGTVTSRRISGDLLEVDAGSARVDRPRAFAAPASASLVSNVVVDSLNADPASPTLRARITLRQTCESAVRVQGTRVYIDISSPIGNAAVPSKSAGTFAPRVAARQATSVHAAAPQRGAEVDARPAVQVVLNRFGEVLPFATSAASAPTAQVLSALAVPLGDLQWSVQGLPASADAGVRAAEGLLMTAVMALSKAVDPAYRGDRVEQVRQAAIFFDEAKREAGPGDAIRPLETAPPSNQTPGR